MKLVTVIVPVYNAEKYLEECIESILNQTYPKIEVVLIDDGSTDSSKNICDSYAKNDNRVIVVHKQNEGVSIARNTGLEIAKGELIAFCDADDYYHPNQIEKMVAELEDKEAELCICGYHSFENADNGDFCVTEDKGSIWTKDEAIHNVLCNDMCKGYLWNKLFYKSIIDAKPKNYFETDISILEDEIFVLQYLKKIDTACFISSEFYGYRQTSGSAIHQGITDRMYSMLLGWFRIYKILKELDCPKEDILTITIPLSQTCCLYYRKTFVKKNINGLFWRKEILKILSTIPKEYITLKNWRFKDRVTLVILKLLIKTGMFKRG